MKDFQGRFKRADRGRMTDRDRELVPDNWSLVRVRELSTGLCSERGYSEQLGCLQKYGAAGKECKGGMDKTAESMAKRVLSALAQSIFRGLKQPRPIRMYQINKSNLL